MYKNGFSIITVTNRDYCIENMINNFLRQEFNDKELIIVINNDKLNIEDIYKYINKKHQLLQYFNLLFIYPYFIIILIL